MGRSGGAQWYTNLAPLPSVAFRLIGRLGKDGQSVMEYYLIPRNALPGFPWTLEITNADEVDAYRLDDLATVAHRLTNSMKRAERTYGLMFRVADSLAIGAGPADWATYTEQNKDKQAR
jgi:hypothetical protein